MANDTRFGLAATLVTGDPERAERVSCPAQRRHRLGQLLLRPRPRRTVRRQREVRHRPRRRRLLVRLLLRRQEHACSARAAGRVGAHRPSRTNDLMGEVVGAGLLAHVPTIVLPEATRRELNDGRGHHAGRRGCSSCAREVFDTLDYDTVVVLDSHWATTVEFVVTAQDAPGRPVHLRGAAARDEPAALRLPRRPRAGPR